MGWFAKTLAKVREADCQAIEKNWLKASKHNKVVLAEVYMGDVSRWVDRGWQLMEVFSQGFAGTTKAIIAIDRAELEGRL